MKILLLCDYRPYQAATVCEHINSFYYYSSHDVYVYSGLVLNNGNLPKDIDLEAFDAVIIHYSLFLAIDAYISEKTKHLIKQYSGLKAIFIQDEYRFVDATVQRLGELGFHILFTCVPEKEIEKVYPKEKLPGLCKINVFTGYVSQELAVLYQPKQLKNRMYDVSYRGRRYPIWHGRLGLEKWKIAEKFRKQANKAGLKTNISYKEENRLYGSRWVELIRDSRAVLGVESGASVFDFAGQVSSKVETVEALIGKKKSLRMYDEIRDKYFRDIEDKISLEQISPRVFEAIALRTLCILYEGEYSGILKAWKHYVPLKKDHSNFDEVISVLKDESRCAEIIADAYAEVAMNPAYSYQTFIKKFDTIMEEELNNRHLDEKEREYIEPEEFYEKYMFIAIRYPHSLVSRTSWVSRILSMLKRFLPSRIKNTVRMMLTR